jgi:hypothetical protein
VDAASADADASRRVFVVRLIDRRTGQTHRVIGSPIQRITRTPDLAAAELLAGRDASVWDAQVEPFGFAQDPGATATDRKSLPPMPPRRAWGA